ncbi:hypothetical protein JCM15124A_14570 [Prevotella falsenii]
MYVMPVQAQTEYDLYIAGTKVTSTNCGDLSVINGVTGKATYTPATKTLILENATINGGEENGITSNTEGLTIKIAGTNNIISDEYTALQVDKSATITGGGVLNLQAESSSALYVRITDLTIDNCTVNAKGLYGIAGINGTYDEKVTIRNADVTAEGTKKGSVCDLAGLILEGCNITQPAGAKFDAEIHAVVLDGEKVKSKVVITKDPTSIDSPNADAVAAKGIYTLQGVGLQGTFESLPKGVYIVNGKKIIKK